MQKKRLLYKRIIIAIILSGMICSNRHIISFAMETEEIVQVQQEAEEERNTSETDLGYVPGQIIVTYDPSKTDCEAIAETVDENQDAIQEEVEVAEDTTMAVVEISDDVTVQKAIDDYEDAGIIAQPNYVMYAFDNEGQDEIAAQNVITNDPSLSHEWYLNAVNTEGAWNIINGNANEKVKVAVLDTGADWNHNDLSSVINRNLSKTVVGSDVTSFTGDDNGHGTHVAGIIAAEANNGVGITGVASGYDNSVVDMMVIDVFPGETTNTTNVVKGLEYAVSQGAKVINMSLGVQTNQSDSMMETACQKAYEQGVVLVCAAGNALNGSSGGTEATTIPSDYSSTISVINVNSGLQRDNTSNYGMAKDLSAPGTKIYSTYKNNSYAEMTGTSMAAPIVTAVAAMMLKVNPNLSPDQVKSILCNTATDLGTAGKDKDTGAGIVNAGAAVENASGEAYVPVPEASVSYQVHVQKDGWQNVVSDGALSGTIGRALRLEGIKINVNSKANLSVAYKTHVQTYGWQSEVSDGALSGTTGESKRLEAIQIRLTGNDADKYDIYYRVHAQTYGWLGWASNGASAGTEGYAKRLEAIEIQIVKKGTGNYGTLSAFVKKPMAVSYQTHVQTYGWQSSVENGAQSGTTGIAKRLEGIKIKINNPDYSGGITYSTHVQKIGWQSKVSNGELAGTTGRALRLEAITIELTGNIANYYDVYYRTHTQHFGWTGWAKNGAECGSQGYAYRLEAIQIQLVPKGGAAPGNTDNTFYKK